MPHPPALEVIVFIYCFSFVISISTPTLLCSTKANVTTLEAALRTLNVMNGLALGVACYFSATLVSGTYALQLAFLTAYFGCVALGRLDSSASFHCRGDFLYIT